MAAGTEGGSCGLGPRQVEGALGRCVAGLSGRQVRKPGWHPREGGVTAGRALNGSGSCFPERSGQSSQGLTSAERRSGECEGRSIKPWREQGRTVPACPSVSYLDESSFLREREVGGGDGRRPRPSP